jgi:hypothetical protein
MHTGEQFDVEAGKLSTTSRITRIALGAALLGFTMTHDGVLGVFAVLPLLAIYPILSGVLGYGLVELAAVRERRAARPAGLRRTIRAIHVIFGSVLIGAVMAGVTQQVWLALLGIYPILLGILGANLLGEAFRTRHALQRAGRVYPASSQIPSLSKKARPAVTIDDHAQKAA